MVVVAAQHSTVVLVADTYPVGACILDEPFDETGGRCVYNRDLAKGTRVIQQQLSRARQPQTDGGTKPKPWPTMRPQHFTTVKIAHRALWFHRGSRWPPSAELMKRLAVNTSTVSSRGQFLNVSCRNAIFSALVEAGVVCDDTFSSPPREAKS